MHFKYITEGYREHFKKHPLQEKSIMTEDQIKHMVNRFLCWRLPEDFYPDCGIHFDADAAKKMNPRNNRYEPVGTNLFTATQTDAMVRHMIEGVAATESHSDMLRPVSRALRDDMVLQGGTQFWRLLGSFDRKLWNDWAESIGDVA